MELRPDEKQLRFVTHAIPAIADSFAVFVCDDDYFISRVYAFSVHTWYSVEEDNAIGDSHCQLVPITYCEGPILDDAFYEQIVFIGTREECRDFIIKQKEIKKQKREVKI